MFLYVKCVTSLLAGIELCYLNIDTTPHYGRDSCIFRSSTCLVKSVGVFV